MATEPLQAAVEDALRRQSLVDPREIHVRVQSGVVILSGQVDSVLEKRRARQAAESVPGARGVIDHLQIRNFVRRPDPELVEEVRRRLARDPYAPAEIEVYASNGEVRLDGWVSTYAERKAAEEVAWWTPGVINVENLLLVTDEPFVDVSPGEVADTA